MLNVKEAAERIGTTPASVRVWAGRGRFKGARKESTPLGDYWLIPEDQVEQFQKGKPGPKPGAKKAKRR